MMNISTVIGLVFTGWIIRGLFRHIVKHGGGENPKTIVKRVAYREDGSIEWVYKHKFLGYGSKYYYRKDKSLWLKKDYFLRKSLEDHETFYYPSGRVKYSTI